MEPHRIVHKLARLAELAAVVIMGDVRAHSIDEIVVVGDDGHGDALEREEMGGEPIDSIAVEVVGRLVEEEELRLVEDGDGDQHAHLPTARERGHLGVAELGRELDAVEDVLRDCVGAHVLRGLGLKEVAHQDAILAVEVVADVMGAQVLGEAGDVLGGEAVEQRSLAGPVLADEAVTVAALEADVGLAKEDTASEGEDDVLDVEGEVLVTRVSEDALGHLREHVFEELDSGISNGGEAVAIDGDDAAQIGLEPVSSEAHRILEILHAHHRAQLLL
mmetsp:Transcript_2694/g.5666  ORF Transcript_2694/g.5666 Transcript_2694/m.5666 type:complete len:276 (-) Transcript_2694:1624-2451(-)